MLESIMSSGGETAVPGGYPRLPHTLAFPNYPPSALSSMMGKIWSLNSLLSPPNSDTTEQDDNKAGLLQKSMGPLSPTLFCGTPPNSMSGGLRPGQLLPPAVSVAGRLPTHPPYITCNCGQLFPSLALLENHMARSHPENTNIPCTLCNKQFPSLSKLQRHMSNHQDGPDLRKFKCSHCGKAFKFKHHLKEHERIHTGEKPFECKHCGKRFSHSGSYSSHTTSKKCLIGGGRGRGANLAGNNAANVNTSAANGGSLLASAGKLNSSGGKGQTTPTPSWPVYKPEPRSTFPSPPGNLSDQPTPLTLPGFSPPPHGHPSPYHHPALLMLAAQNNPFLSRQFALPPGLAMPPVSATNQTSLESNLEHLQKLFGFGKFSSNLELPKIESNHGNEEHKLFDRPPMNPTDVEPDRSVSPPRSEEPINSTNITDNDKLTANDEDKIKTEADFKIIDSFKHNFEQNNQFNFFKSMLDRHQNFRRGFGASSVFDSSMNGSEEDQYEDSVESEEGTSRTEEERKVRVRTLISEEQQMVLKAHYQRNPKPKKEVLQEISAHIGHPFRVVKVWFQNMRARDRREGRHIPQLPFPGGAAHHPAFLNNNFPGFQGINGLPLPLLRPPGSFLPPGLAGSNGPMPFPFQTALQNMFDLPKTPESSSRSDNNDDIEDDDGVDEDENEDVDVEFETPLDLSNKGSTPGASPIASADDRDDDHVIVDPIGMSSSSPLRMEEDENLAPNTGASLYRTFKSRLSEEIEPRNLQLPEALFHCKKCDSGFQDFLKYSQHLKLRSCEDESNNTETNASIEIDNSIINSTDNVEMDDSTTSTMKPSTTA